ncbi:hypothetical protein CRYUN_Cryun11dG0112800 [Craigia yunnanensis]
MVILNSQHPYFYEEDDVWMAPGFINLFYEVPDYWKTYVHEVDQEREMWLKSFYKASLRLPMPAELEYWWSKGIPPHSLLSPPQKEGEEVDPKKVKFLPLGFDEFYGREVIVKRDNIWNRVIMAIENALKPGFAKLGKWTEEKKKAGEMKMKHIEKELDRIEAELCLEEAIEDMDEELRMKEKEEEKKVKMGLQEEEDTFVVANQEGKATKEEEDEDVDEEEDDFTPSSFGSVAADRNKE